MKRYLYLFASLVVAFAFVGCGGSDEKIEPPVPPTPDVVDVVEPTNATSKDGFKRVELSWTQDCSADIASTTIYWNNRKNSQVQKFTPAASTGTQNEGVEITITEGEYEFELVNTDSKGNKSDAVKVSARAYGEDYCSELETRTVSSIFYEDDTAFITWAEALEGEIRTEYVYVDAESGDEVKAVVEAEQEQIKVLPLEVITVQTVYKPDGCMDELFSPAEEVVVPEPEPVIVSVPTDVYANDGYERVELCWSYNADDVAKTVITWNDGEESEEVAASANSGEQQESLLLSLAEGEYTFKLKNLDAKGNESEEVIVSARVYGVTYCSQLQTREIISIVYEEDHAVVEWADAPEGVVRTEYRYIDADSGEDDWAIVTETQESVNTLPNTIIKVESIYQPEGCMDELWSKAVEYTVPEPEIIDVVEPTALSSMDGLGRVQLSWTQDCSADIAKTVIVWDSGSKEVEFTPQSTSGEQQESLEMTLAEGDYAFTLQNIDSKGNESDAVEVEAHSYGEQYRATLPTRELLAISFATNSTINLDLMWGTACEGEIRTKYTFTHTETGALTTKTAQPTSSKSTFVKAKPGTMIKVESVYKPENCLDEIESLGVEYEVPGAPAGPELVDVKVMQFNVCVGNWLGCVGDYFWSERKEQIAALIMEQEPDIICFQELSVLGYYNDIMKAINTTYSNSVGDVYSGVYGERGNPTNEGIALVYKTSRFDKVSSGMFWLNDHPDTAGLYSAGGMTSNYNRICVWGRFHDKTTQGEFVAASTHIDNANNDAHASTGYAVMNGQIQIAINNVQARSGGEDDNLPIVIAGDMNANPGLSPINRFSNSSNKYTDAYTVAEQVTTQSTEIPRSTMVDHSGSTATQNYACFDYIFVKRHNKVLSYSINPARYNGVTMSDHNSVTAVVRLECKVME